MKITFNDDEIRSIVADRAAEKLGLPRQSVTRTTTSFRNGRADCVDVSLTVEFADDAAHQEQA